MSLNNDVNQVILPIHALMARWLIWRLDLKASLSSIPHWVLIGYNAPEPVLDTLDLVEFELMYQKERAK